jgi:hypothetical protein
MNSLKHNYEKRQTTARIVRVTLRGIQAVCDSGFAANYLIAKGAKIYYALAALALFIA